MNKKFRFLDFQVYKDAKELRKGLKVLSHKFPKDEDYCLRTQLWRALDSIILNIAEGSDRSTDKDFAHFLNTSSASLNEVVACIDIANDSKYISDEEMNKHFDLCYNLGNQITAFRKKLLYEPTK